MYEFITTTLASTSLSYYDEESDDRDAKGVSKTTEGKTPMRKTTIIPLVTTFFLATVYLAEAQQPGKIPRIGFVSGAGDANNPGPNVEAFRQGLRELGYVEGKNHQVEYRYIEGKSERIASLVTDLIQLKVDVLVTASLVSTRVAKKETKTIPIVFNIPDDPVALGLIDSLARPGGNITGVTRIGRELSGKRLELLTEAVPGIKRVGVMYSTTGVVGTATRRNFEDYEVPARALKITAQSITVRNPSQDLDMAFRKAVKGRANAVIIISTTPVLPFRKKITDLAIKNRMPLFATPSPSRVPLSSKRLPMSWAWKEHHPLRPHK